MKTQRIREMISNKGLTHTFVAKKLGMTRQNFSFQMQKENFPEKYDNKLKELFGESDELKSCQEKIKFLEELIRQKDLVISQLSK